MIYYVAYDGDPNAPHYRKNEFYAGKDGLGKNAHYLKKVSCYIQYHYVFLYLTELCIGYLCMCTHAHLVDDGDYHTFS